MRVTSVIVGFACAAACTEYEPASDTLLSGAVTELSPADRDPRWACLGQAVERSTVPVVAETVDRVVYSIQVVDLSTGQLYPDAEVRACGVTDINCENPVTDTLSVDAEGWVDVPLFKNFLGFIEITSARAVPYLFYLTEPISQSSVEYPVAIVSLVSLGPLIELLGVEFDPSTGVIATRAFDCEGNTASGVSLRSESAGVTWYFADGLPTSSGTATGADGLGGLVNVPPGLAVVDMTTSAGVSISGPQSVVVRPNWLSAVHVRPPSRRASLQ